MNIFQYKSQISNNELYFKVNHILIVNEFLFKHEINDYFYKTEISLSDCYLK